MATEVHHNTVEQTRDYVTQALGIVNDADVPDDLRVAAFTAAVGLVASKQVFIEQSDVSPVVRAGGLLTH